MPYDPLEEIEQTKLMVDAEPSPSVDSLIASTPDPLIGQTIGGHYKILELVGEGGMGMVYKASHLLLNRIMAVKILLPHLAARADTVKRFQREGQATISLRHENICAVHELGVYEQFPFLVMEYLDGRSLADQLKQNIRLEQEVSLQIVKEVCEALEHAHANNVIHRDIKPSNIALVKDRSGTERIKIVDFGIAKVLHDDCGTDLTKTGEVFGTPKYMSPEQIEGKRIDERSDIYSLGCVLYEMLAGHAPFEGESALSVAFKHVNEKPPAIADPNVDGWLKQIVYKSLEKNPKSRYQSISELKADLNKRQSSVPVVSRPVIRSSGRQFSAMTALAIVCIVTAIFVGFNVLKKADSTSSQSSTIKTIACDDIRKVISKSGVSIDRSANHGKPAIKMYCDKPTVFRLVEVPISDTDNCRLVYRAKLKTKDLKGKAFLEMWCHFPDKGEFFSRALDQPLSETSDWVSVETPFFLKAGEKPDRVKLNLVVDGSGTAWIGDAELAKKPL